MSARSGKSGFFGFLKNAFRKSGTNGNGSAAPSATEEAPQTIHGAPPIETAPRPLAALPPKRTQNGNGRAPAAPGAAPAPARNAATLQVSLQAIINSLPLELRGKVVHPEVGDVTVAVALDKVLSQLSQGTVKIPFGDVRQSAPYAFTSESDGDRVAVTLPLNEILSQLNPSLLVRRPAQKSVEVPSDIASPFDAKGEGVVFSVGNNAKPVAPASPRQVAPAPATPARGSISSVSLPPPPAASAPSASLPQAAPIPMPKFGAPAPVVPANNASPAAPISPLIPMEPFAMRPAASAAPIPVAQPVKSAQPVPVQAAPAAKPTSDAGSLTVALKAVAEAWPEALRQEIVQTGLVDARVALPCDVIEPALKRGRAIFPWKVVRSWIRPATAPGVSVHDSTEVELPLRIVAPLFLARQSAAAKDNHKPAIDETIPNLFFGFPKPDSASAAAPQQQSLPKPPAASVSPSGNLLSPAPKQTDTNYYVWNDTSDTTTFNEAEVKKKAGPSGTDFVSRYATPNEIVSRAAALDGVAGALIALPDGLMVASRLAPEINGDTLAAFLPQIFAKVNQCTRELRMGELNNLNFTVGNVPWKIFRVNAIFFAAFGRVAEALPTADLAALAAELDRKR